MFGRNKEKPSIAASASEPAAKPELWGEIYTMPSNYQSATPASRGSNKKIWTVILAVLLVSIVGVLVYLFVRSLPEEPVSPPTTTQPTSTETPTTPSPTNPPELVTASERDRVRFRDIREIQAALELYFAESKQYPLAPLSMVLGTSSSNVLSAAGFSGSPQGVVYLTPVPKNPEPGGSPYLYESFDGASYSLRFNLEEGTAGLDQGDHVATPGGIDEKAPLPEPAPGPREVVPPPATTDTDADGLTDAEEAILGADASKPDTDSDGYTDGSELDSGYDPTLGQGALLKDSSKLVSYANDAFAYQLVHPADWTVEKIKADFSEILISGGGAEFMSVLVVSNPDQLTATEWYAKQFPSLKESEVPQFKVGEFEWAMSPDGLIVYLATTNNLITFSYNIGTAEQASYYSLFKAMIRLFTLSASEQTLPTPFVQDNSGQ